jgi:hypothetical protein
MTANNVLHSLLTRTKCVMIAAPAFGPRLEAAPAHPLTAKRSMSLAAASKSKEGRTG